MIYLQDPDFTLHQGDVRDVLRELPSESVDCALTSPPFFGLRDYGTGQWEGGDPGCDHKPPPSRFSPTSTLKNDGRSNPGAKNYELQTPTPYAGTCRKCGARRIDRQIGLEATPDEWVTELVGVFREVRRVLRPAGTLWIECGDSYAASMTSDRRMFQPTGPDGRPATGRESVATGQRTAVGGLKPKDLLGQPWLLAFALRADGWYLRQCLIWQKPNAMPESVRDRCTTGHSYVFLLSKQPRYFFDSDAIAEPAAWERWGDQTTPKYNGTDTTTGWIQPKTKAELRMLGEPDGEGGWVAEERGADPSDVASGSPSVSDARKALHGPTYSRHRSAIQGGQSLQADPNGRKNARSVWTIPTQGYAEAHFATWPEALVERILKAGCPEWVCGTCGKARERLTEASYTDAGNGNHVGEQPAERRVMASGVRKLKTTETVGWSDCGHGNYRPGIALDPFMGSGTTALVARRLGRRSIGVELNPEYCAMAAKRLQQLSLLADG